MEYCYQEYCQQLLIGNIDFVTSPVYVSNSLHVASIIFARLKVFKSLSTQIIYVHYYSVSRDLLAVCFKIVYRYVFLDTY